MSKAANRLLMAVREFNKYYEHEKDHADLVKQLGELDRNVSQTFYPQGEAESPGRDAARAAARGDREPAPMRERDDPGPEQPKSFSEAKARATAVLENSLGGVSSPQ